MKKFILLIFLMTFFCSVSYSQAVKRVLLEQHTGAWCGWCVDGTVIMDELLEAYPEQVIGVKVHNADSMVIPEQSVIANSLGLTGYPMGNVDRHNYGGGVFIYRDKWKETVEQALLESPKVDVQLYYEIDPENRELTATLVTQILESLPPELTFNVLVLEDSCSGVGNQWDQSNYLSGRAGYENNPYYNQPAKIIGYQHMKVVRAYLGGAWGIPGDFGVNPPAVGNEYTHTFKYTLPSNINLDHVWFVGIIAVDQPTDKSFLNVCVGQMKNPPPPAMLLTTNGPEAGVANSGENFEKSYELKNLTETNNSYQISLSKDNQTPNDWEINLDKTKMTLAPGASGIFLASIKVGSTKGFGSAKIMVTSTTDPSAKPVSSIISAASKDIESFEVISSKEIANSLLQYIANKEDYVNVSPSILNSLYDKLPNLKSVIWNLGQTDKMSAGDGQVLTGLANAGINLMIMGDNAVQSLNESNLLNDWGLKYEGYSKEGYSDGLSAPYYLSLKGFENDPISSDWVLNGVYTMRNMPNMHVMSVVDQTNTSPVLCFKNNQTIYYKEGTNELSKQIDGNKVIVAARIQKEQSKIVIIGIHPNDIWAESIKTKIVTLPMSYINSTTDVDIYVTNNIFSMGLAPNPIEAQALINFKVKGETSRKILITLYDILGNPLVNIAQGTYIPGNYDISLDLNGLSSGTYRLSMNDGIRTLSIPVILIR